MLPVRRKWLKQSRWSDTIDLHTFPAGLPSSLGEKDLVVFNSFLMSITHRCVLVFRGQFDSCLWCC